LARKIHNKEVKTASEAFSELKESYPNDDEFQRAFRAKQERNNQKSQYFLKRVEAEAIRQAQAGAELTPGALTVEHILPKNPAAEWDAVIKEDPTLVEDCSLRLGNMCLTTDGANNKVGRKSFGEKREIFGKSALRTTQAVAQHTKWDRQDIDHHQAYLAKLAVQAWRFP